MSDMNELKIAAAWDVSRLDAIVEPILRAGRVPGAALGVVCGNDVLYAKGFGYRDLDARLPMTPQTVYPIASTTKAFNATMIAMLVEEGKLSWDTPVQEYLPGFRLYDPYSSANATLRDLVAMLTGLPRHDWIWMESSITRSELVRKLRFLEPSAGFRERFQYNNISVTVAGHVAEVITGKTWEELVQDKILGPLGMSNTEFILPPAGNVTCSYHESRDRELKLTPKPAPEPTAPSGSAIHSTIEDMARWMSFNLNGGRVGNKHLIKTQLLAETHSPQVAAGTCLSAPTPNAAYALGWYVDTYNGCSRLIHGGYHHDVHSDLALYPAENLGIVAFTNFGPPTLARVLAQQAFDTLMGFKTALTVEEKLALYEKKIEDTRARVAATKRVEDTKPSHSLSDYVGSFSHPGYGEVRIELKNGELVLHRYGIVLPLEHWHYDSWVAKYHDSFFLHIPHAFDPTNRLLFESDNDGRIASVAIRLEESVAPIRFVRARAG